MSARILVVDDVPANVKLLEARLSAEYFDVLTASNGAEALATCARAVPYIACARLVSWRGATFTWPFSNFTSTSSWTTMTKDAPRIELLVFVSDHG